MQHFTQGPAAQADVTDKAVRVPTATPPALPAARTEGNDMNANNSTIRQWAAVWLLITGAPALGANTRSAYLPLTGPTPLRFEVASVKPAAPTLAATAPSQAEKSGDKNPGATGPSPTNTLADIHYSAGDPTPPTDVPGESETPYPSPVHPLNDRPLIVTPQMLAEYFKPAANSTNVAGVSVFLPVSVSFKPPTDAAPARSRATYKTE